MKKDKLEIKIVVWVVILGVLAIEFMRVGNNSIKETLFNSFIDIIIFAFIAILISSFFPDN